MTCAVVMATYNGEKYVKEQLNSILNQTRKPDSIIVTDDNSTDNTVKICKEILEASKINYKILVHEKKQYVTNNFFDGIRQNECDIIFFSDQDDVWSNNKIESIMKIFENNPLCMVVLCDAYVWNGEKIGNKTLLELWGDKYPYYDLDGLIDKNALWEVLIDKNIATGMSMAIKKEISMYQKKDLLMFHDSWYCLVGAAMGNIYLINKPLAYYRQHENNVEGVIHKPSLKKIKESVIKVDQSIQKSKERNDIITFLDTKYLCLNKKNREYFSVIKGFLEKREEYIKSGSPFKLLKIIINNSEKYRDKNFIIRDLLVCLINSMRIKS